MVSEYMKVQFLMFMGLPYCKKLNTHKHKFEFSVHMIGIKLKLETPDYIPSSMLGWETS